MRFVHAILMAAFVLWLTQATCDDKEPHTFQSDTDLPTIELTTPAAPPESAPWERHLLAQLEPAALEFVRKYTRDDGTLIWRDQWPGMDGSDDGYESFYNFPLYYALGGP